MYVILAVLLTTFGCATAPTTARSGPMVFPQRSEDFLGRQELSYYKKHLKVSQNQELNDSVARVGQRLAAAADRSDYQWEFIVFENDNPMAFSLPGGKVGVCTGILPYTQDEAGLAALLAHEIAHGLLRHPAEQKSQFLLWLLSMGLYKPVDAPEVKIAGKITDYPAGVQQGYRRQQEAEADEMGMILMAKAGYDPAAAVAFWERLLAASKNRPTPLPYLTINPADTLRLQDSKRMVPRIKDHYYQNP